MRCAALRRPVAGTLPALAALVLGQCASGPEPPESAVRLQPSDTVVVVHASPELELGLVTRPESSPPEADAVPNAKVVSTESMQWLLDVFATEGFFARSAPGVSGDHALRVVINDRELVWAKPDLDRAGVERFQQYSRCRGYFQALYNRVTSFHSSNMSKEELERRMRELEEWRQRKLREASRDRKP